MSNNPIDVAKVFVIESVSFVAHATKKPVAAPMNASAQVTSDHLEQEMVREPENLTTKSIPMKKNGNTDFIWCHYCHRLCVDKFKGQACTVLVV